jgi:hypothetical protein
MQAIALGMAPPGHAAAVAETVLRGLGVPADQARAAATMPLPDLPPAGPAPVPAETGSARGVRRKR